MCGIVGYVGPSAGEPPAARGPQAPRVPGLRLGRHRDALQRELHDPPLAGQARQPRREARRGPGHGRASGSGTRAGRRTAGRPRRTRTRMTRLLGQDRRRPQRHHRELRRAQGGAGGRGPPFHERDRHRGLRARGRGRVPGRSARRGAARPCGKLSGAYAVLVSSSREPGVLVAARSGPPIVLGLGKGENFVASDPVALVPWTRDVIFLEDGDVARVDVAGARVVEPRRATGSSGPFTGSCGMPWRRRRAATGTSWPRRSTSSRRRSRRPSAARSRSRPGSSTSTRRCSRPSASRSSTACCCWPAAPRGTRRWSASS